MLMNTQTGETRQHSVALQDDEAFVHWLAQQNSQAPQGWMFVRPQDVQGTQRS